MLGGEGQFGGGVTATRTLSDLPSHDQLRVRARLLSQGPWDNKALTLSIGGKQVWTTNVNHNWTTGGVWSQHHDIDITLPHTGGTATLAFTSTTTVDPKTASWAIDWLRADAIAQPKNVPQPCAGPLSMRIRAHCEVPAGDAHCAVAAPGHDSIALSCQ